MPNQTSLTICFVKKKKKKKRKEKKRKEKKRKKNVSQLEPACVVAHA